MSAGLARVLLFCGVLTAAARAQDEVLTLEPNRVFAGEFALEQPGSLCFALELPVDVVALDLRLDCSLADLDLYVHPGEHADELELSTWASVGDDGEERVSAHRLDLPGLEGGRLAVCVWYAWEGPPLVDGRPLVRAPFRLEARVFAARVDAELRPGIPHPDTLRADSGGFRTYAVDVPAGAPALRVDLFDAAGDLDLFARHRVRVLSAGPRLAVAQNPWGAETLLLVPEGQPPLRPGRWYVQVENLVDPTEPASFSILASLAPGVPELVRGLPRLGAPADARGVARALPGVFELFCGPLAGSGTCVSRDGWILTNAHVVDTGRDDPVIVCAPVARGLPARESFRGRVVLLDRERDLALVRVERGFWGEEIPAEYVFPAVPLGDPGALEIGDPLLLAGYPTTGGQRSRVSISLSRGIVSGFERGPLGLLIKTDAELEGGSSGGAALDEAGRLVGVPTSKVEVGSGHFGFVLPLDALPAEWRARLGL